MLSLIFEYIVLFLLCFKYKFHKISSQTTYKSIISRLSRFVAIYTIIRFLPALARFWGICSSSNSVPYWLILSHHICIACIGIANGIAWNINQRDPNTHIKKQKLAEYLMESTTTNLLCSDNTSTILTSCTSNNDNKLTVITPT